MDRIPPKLKPGNSTVNNPFSVSGNAVPVCQCAPLSKLYSVLPTPDKLSDAVKETTTLIFFIK